MDRTDWQTIAEADSGVGVEVGCTLNCQWKHFQATRSNWLNHELAHWEVCFVQDVIL